MSRHLLLLGLALALCGCGDTAKSPAGGGTAATGGASASGTPATNAAGTAEVAKDVTKEKDEEMADGDGAAGDAGDKVAAKEETPSSDGDKEASKDTEKDADKGDEKPEKITIQKAFQAANKFMQKRDIKGAVAELEKALPDNPDDANLLLNLAALSQQAAGANKDEPDYDAYKKAGEYLRLALKADKSLAENPNIGNFAGNIFYNEACALAKQDKPAEALKSLEEAVASGLKNIAQMEKDADLESVRKLAEYPEFLAKAQEIVREHQKKELDKIFAETKPFDFTFELTDIEGNAIAMADLKGKVAIIDVWGTWCPPCRMEIPHFVELQNKYKDAGFEIVGLNSEGGDEEEAVKKVQEFHKENKMNYRCALVKKDTLDQIPNLEGYPTTLFFDRAGKVRAKVVGYHDLDMLDAIVSRLLEEKADAPKEGAEDKSEKEAKVDEEKK